MVTVTDYLISRQAIVREKDSIKLVGSNDQETVPSTIRDLINRQVETLADDDRELLETASMSGASFSVSLIARVLGREREAVERRCRELAQHEHFLQYIGTRKRPSGTIAALYGFTHVLYQNIIYDRVGQAKRQRLHQLIGERLERVFEGATEQVAVELALHFEQAGNYQRAVHYLIQAAQKATQRSAYQEAITHATSGLRLLKSLRDDRLQAEMELHLQLTISVSLASTRGYAAAEVSEAFNRANQLCQKVKDESLRMQTLSGLFTFHCMRGELRSALDFGKQMIFAAQTIKDRAYLADGHTYTGIALFYLGEFTAAQEHFNQAIAACGLADEARSAIRRPDALAFLLTYTAVNLWLMGYLTRAAEKRDQALFMAIQLSHPLGVVITQMMLGGNHQCRREASEAMKLAEEGIKSASEYGFSHWLAAGTMLKGWVLATLGQRDEGMSLLREGLKNWRAIGSKAETARFMYLLADTHLLANRVKAGLSLVDEALALVEETEDRFYQSELTWLRGELLLRTKTRAGKRAALIEAESHFLKAIEIARRQKAKSFELRATISLALLWQETGKKKEAKRMLAKIYGWFTEGFDSPDLKEANRLLDELG
jgi:predicted ATPase